tara:strand:- start:1007 stop:1396 length:390 start_codon:yes stop_codon:yes gene_type:complete
MLIENHIIRDIVLSELTNEPLDKESQKIIDAFDNVFNQLRKEQVGNNHTVWIDSAGRWLVNYYESSQSLKIYYPFYEQLNKSLYGDTEGNVFRFLLEKYLDVDCVGAITTEFRSEKYTIVPKKERPLII